MFRTTYLLFAISLLFGLTYGLYTPTMPIFASNEMNATYQDLGVIGMATFLPYVVIPLVIGVILERINSKYLLTAGFAVNALALYLIFTANTITELIVYSLLAGFAYSLIWPPAMHTLAKNPETRVRFTAIFTMCFVVGYMIGPMMGSMMLEISGVEHRTLFLVMVYMISAGVISIMLKYPHHRTKEAHVDLHLFKEVLKFPMLVVVMLYSTVTFGLVLSIYPAFLQEHGFDASTVMHLYAIFGITRILGFLLSTRLSVHRKAVLFMSTSCVVLAMIISMLGSTFVDFAAVMLLLGFGFASIYSVAMDMMLSGSSKFASSRLVGIYESIFGIGWAIGPLASGYIGYTMGTDNLYLILSISGLAVLLLIFLYRNRMYTAITTLKLDSKSKKGRAIFVKQTLKNHLGVISMSVGLINRSRENDGKGTDVIGVLKTMNDTKDSVNEMLDEAKDIIHPQLIKDIRAIMESVGGIEIATPSKDPDYNDVKKMLAYCTNRLDRSMNDDAILK